MNYKTIHYTIVVTFFISAFYMFSTGNPFFTILTTIALIGSAIYGKKQNEDFREHIKDLFLKTLQSNSISYNHYLFGDDTLNGIALDEEKKELIIAYRYDIDDNSFKIKKYHYKDIIEVHYKEDGVTINKINRGSQVGGALIGGAIAGGVGAIIGGMGASSTLQEKIKTITLEIVVDDINNPTYKIKCLNMRTPIERTDELYKRFSEISNIWYRRIGVIIHNN